MDLVACTSHTYLKSVCQLGTDASFLMCRAGALGTLPEEMLWTILGYLDVRTLCTACCVCKRFRQCGQGHFKTLRLNCAALRQNLETNFTQFSGLTRLCVSLESETRLPLLTQPGVAPLVTHIRLDHTSPEDKHHAERLARLALLPKLRSVAIPGKMTDVIQFLPVGLEKLILLRPIRKGASVSPLTRLSGLTSLALHGELHAAPPPSSLRGLSTLHNLRSLSLRGFPSSLHVLSTLTMLSSLTWVGALCISRDLGSVFPGLAHLTGLSRLKVSRTWGLGLDCIAQIDFLTGLTSLDLSECGLARDVIDVPALAPLTRLVSVGLFSGFGARSYLPSLNIEALESLTLSNSGGDVRVLHRATGLTHFEPAHDLKHFPVRLGLVVAIMSRLRSLSLCLTGHDPGAALALVTGHPWHAFHLSDVLGSLTNLTKLKYAGPFTEARDMAACVSLPSLQDLEFHSMQGVTLASLPALQAMSGLTKLTLRHSLIHVVDLTPKVRAAFDAPRLLRGWPPLKIEWT